MKNTHLFYYCLGIWIISILSLKGQSQQQPDLHFYTLNTYRAWYYGEKLLKMSSGDEREIYELDLAASAFDYFLLLRNQKIKKSRVIEGYIKKLFSQNLIRKDFVDDPINFHRNFQLARRGTSMSLFITDENYPELKNEFLNFIKSIPSE